MNPRFGTADKWFTFGALTFAPGITAFVVSFNPGTLLAPLMTLFYVLGLILSILGAFGLIGGVLVWAYNLRHPVELPVVLGDSSAPSDVQIVALQDRANKLNVEKAGLAVEITARERADLYKSASTAALAAFRPLNPEELAKQKALAEAKARVAQIESEVSGIWARIGQIRDEQKPAGRKRGRNLPG